MNAPIPQPDAWFNGETISLAEARLSVFDLGVMQAVTVSEMLRTFRHEPFRVEAHLERFAGSLAQVGLSIPYTSGELAAALRDVVARNARHLEPDDDLGISLFATAGCNTALAAQAGLELPSGPTVCIHTFRLPFHLWIDAATHGQTLLVSEHVQIPPSAVLPHIKSRSRLHWYLAEQSVRRRDPKAVALISDGTGGLLETATANFLFVRDGKILTPPYELTLPGISRTVLAELAAELRIPFEFCRVTLEDVAQASEAWTASTPYCLLPVASMEGIRIGDGGPGPVYRQLVQAWNRLAGLDIIAQFTARGSRQARP